MKKLLVVTWISVFSVLGHGQAVAQTDPCAVMRSSGLGGLFGNALSGLCNTSPNKKSETEPAKSPAISPRLGGKNVPPNRTLKKLPQQS